MSKESDAPYFQSGDGTYADTRWFDGDQVLVVGGPNCPYTLRFFKTMGRFTTLQIFDSVTGEKLLPKHHPKFNTFSGDSSQLEVVSPPSDDQLAIGFTASQADAIARFFYPYLQR